MTTTTRPQSHPRHLATSLGMGGAAVASVGTSLPPTVVHSHEIEARLGLTPDWIERRTGIRARRIAADHERLDVHATAAAAEALAHAGVDAKDVDLVIVGTSTPEELMPQAAPLVASALGATRAGAFDLSAACTGFLSGLATGASMIDAGRAGCIVVVGADFMSRITDPNDRSTAAVFADGAGAVVLLATGEPTRVGPVVLGAEGDVGGTILLPHNTKITMHGHETYKEAVNCLSVSTEQAVDAAEVTLDEIDLFVYHQANSRILAAVAERLGLHPERVVDCIAELGNTSAATLPLALAESVRAGRLHEGDRVLLGAFGAGFTWGATVLEWGVPA